MDKPNSLRAFLTTALPQLKRDPDALSIYVTGGTLATRHGANLGFEMRYDLHLVLLNYQGAPEQIFLPLCLWLREHQSELIQNHDTGVQAIRFNVDVVDNQAVDVEVILPLTEAVDVDRDGDGYKATVRAEQPFADQVPMTDALTLLRQIWAPGGPASSFLVGHPDDEGG